MGQTGLTPRLQTVSTDEELGAGSVGGVEGIPYYGYAMPTFEDVGTGTVMGFQPTSSTR